MAVLKIILQICLIAIVQFEVGANCPNACQCIVNKDLIETESICEVDGSSVNVTWNDEINQRVLEITCQGATISCDYLPQFGIHLDIAKVVVKNCGPSMLRCVTDIYSSRRPSTVMALDVIKLAGEYTAEDFEGFDSVSVLYLDLRDTDEELPASVINSLPSLQEVSIVGGNLKLLSNVFDQSRISSFRLEHNNIKRIPAEAFNGLTNLEKIKIDGSIEEISTDAFRGLNKLEDICISNLKMSFIDRKIFLAPKNLAHLSLVNTQIQNITTDFLMGMKKLKTFQIKGNQKNMTFENMVFAWLPSSIYDITITDCRVRSLPFNLFWGPNHPRNINFDNNMIKDVPPMAFTDLHYLNSISLKNNSIKYIYEDYFASTERIETIDLSHNNIGMVIRDMFVTNPELRVLNLNNNNISYVDKNAFRDLNLRKLDLSSNKLQTITFGDTLLWQTRLLNLSHNHMTQFESWFGQINNLTHLDLRHNNITMIKESDIYSFKSGTKIDLRFNQISKILRDIPEEKFLETKEKVEIYLSNNPIECNSLSITILKEWRENNILADFDDINCEDIGQVSTVADTEGSLVYDKENTSIILIGSIIVGTIILILLIITIYLQRKKLKISIIQRNKENFTSYDITQDSLKKYDVFVSSAYQDHEFVIDKILPKLENDMGLKVCYHNRAFLVGDDISDLIVKSVEDSRMTIIILTENFLVSDWSYLEFRTAHNLSMQGGKSKIIVVLLNKDILKNKDLNDDLKSHIAVNKYLLWEDSKFWKKLQKMLPKSDQINQ